MTLVATWLLSALLGVAAVQKLARPHEPRSAPSALLRKDDTRLMALTVCLLEAAASISLMFPPARRGGAVLAIALGTGFVVANIASHVERIGATCGCFGSLGRDKTLGLRNLAWPAVILAAAIYLLLFPDLLHGQAVADRFGLLAGSTTTLLAAAIPPVRMMLVLRAGRRTGEPLHALTKGPS